MNRKEDEAAKEFDKLAKKYEADFVIREIYSRADSSWAGAHYQITHKNGFSFQYTRGIWTFSKAEIREAWQMVGAIRQSNGLRKLPDKEVENDFCFALATIAKPSVTTLLTSLFLDAEFSDQNFEDWAPGHGYGSDSVEGKAIWEQCNKIRRFLEQEISRKDFENMQELLLQL